MISSKTTALTVTCFYKDHISICSLSPSCTPGQYFQYLYPGVPPVTQHNQNIINTLLSPSLKPAFHPHFLVLFNGNSKPRYIGIEDLLLLLYKQSGLKFTSSSPFSPPLPLLHAFITATTGLSIFEVLFS